MKRLLRAWKAGLYKEFPYLIPNRIEEVIFLLQYLGLESYSIETPTKPYGIIPRSADDKEWIEVARQHPEFFRATEKSSILTLRTLLRNDDGRTPPIPLEAVQSLIKTAMELHQHQARRADIWQRWLTMIGSVVAAVASVAHLFLAK